MGRSADCKTDVKNAVSHPFFRPLMHLRNARVALASADYSLKAAITELHKTGPHAERAARALEQLAAPFNTLYALVEKKETEKAGNSLPPADLPICPSADH
jgi:hypothetical protein